MNISDITIDQIERVYSGKPGCGCGCLGTYYYDERNIKRVLKAIKDADVNAQALAAFNGVGIIDDTDSDLDNVRVGVMDNPDGTPFCAYAESNKRYYWAYLKA